MSAKKAVSALDEIGKDGTFQRTPATFQDWVSPNSEKGFTPEAGRYHLYVAYGCPWSQRALLARALKGLQPVIGMSCTHPTWQKTRPDDDEDKHWGWAFAKEGNPPLIPNTGHGAIKCEGCEPEPLYGAKTVRDMYDMANYTGSKFTVPYLWDKKTKTIVNNESSQLIKIFNSAFNDVEGITNPDLDLDPEDLRPAAAEVDEWVYQEICNAVYRAGFGRNQEAYDKAVNILFEHLDKLEELLSMRRFIAGDRLTLSDVRALPSLLRFDEVYHTYFKCNKKSLGRDYPNILGFLRDVWQSHPALPKTTKMDHIKFHYYTSHIALNSYSIVPAGPSFLALLDEPHDRDRFDAAKEPASKSARTK